MIEGSCLCGSVRWRFDGQPDGATACNCTACRRYGTLWAYDHVDEGIHVTGATPVVNGADGFTPWWTSGTCVAWPTSRTAGRSVMRVSIGMPPSTVRWNLIRGCVRSGPPSRRTSPGPAPCTARNARPNASVEP